MGGIVAPQKMLKSQSSKCEHEPYLERSKHYVSEAHLHSKRGVLRGALLSPRQLLLMVKQSLQIINLR